MYPNNYLFELDQYYPDFIKKRTDWSILLDFDGTFSRTISAWKHFHTLYDTIEGMHLNSDNFHSSDKMTVHDWATLDSGLWKGREWIGRRANVTWEMLDGYDTIRYIQERWNTKMFIVSGSIHQFITAWLPENWFTEIVAHHLNIDASNKIQGIDDGKQGEWIYNSKRHMVEKILDKYKSEIDPTKLIAVGNGSNDIGMFKMAQHRIAVNPRNDKLKEVSDHIIYTNDFYEVVKAIDGFLLSQEQF